MDGVLAAEMGDGGALRTVQRRVAETLSSGGVGRGGWQVSHAEKKGREM